MTSMDHEHCLHWQEGDGHCCDCGEPNWCPEKGEDSLMTVNMEALRDRIQRLKHTEWTVKTDTEAGPEVYDGYKNHILTVDVPHPVWTCDDEQDGCPESNRNAVALAHLLVDLPEYALELIQAVKRLQWEVQGLERDLEEAERGL